MQVGLTMIIFNDWDIQGRQVQHEPQTLVTCQIWLSLLKTFIPTEGG
jgi:hypothetical protein